MSVVILSMPAKARRFTRAAIAAVCLGMTMVPAVSAGALDDLLEDLSAQSGVEAARDKARERRFSASLSEQKKLLGEAKAEVAKQEDVRDRLKTEFDKNEVELGELSEVLSRRTGDLGELFGVFRQTAGDAQSTLFDSLASAERPSRKQEVAVLAEMKEVPRIEDMEKLWGLMLDEIVQSAKVTRFEADIVKPSGDHYSAPVTRIGSFNVVTGDTYLNYLPESEQLVEFARQPGGSVRGSASDLSGATAGDTIGFAIDPSRGVLLGMLVQAPNLMERIAQGKEVGYAIIVVLIIGLMVVARRLIVLAKMQAGMKKQLADMKQASVENPLGRALNAFYENRHLSVDVVTRKLDEVIVKDVAEIRRGLPLVKVLAAVAPLMGLLGTVTGMIGTFQAITLFGTGDPKLMAGGISQALVTTVLGLVAAIPLLLSHSLLSTRAQSLTKILAEQAAGMVATQAENLEKRV